MKYGELTLGQIEALVNKLGGLEGVNRILFGASEVVALEMLKFVGTIVVPGTPAFFEVRKRFRVRISANAPVKVVHLWDNFKEWFLAGGGKIEKPLPERALRYHELLQDVPDTSIIAALGGEEKVESALAGVYGLMTKQPRGEQGALLTNTRQNIFYVRDCKGVMRSVHVDGGCGGWYVGAFAVDHPDSRQSAGSRVFSPNS